MKAQSKWGSFIESVQNTAIGFGIQTVATYYLAPWFHMHPSVGDALGYGLVMTVISVARGWCVRRWHEYRRNKNTPPDFAYIVEELATERVRHISGEGYTLEHDDEHVDGEIAAGAAAYCLAAANRIDGIGAVQVNATAIPGTRVDAIRKAWAWGMGSFKPTTARRNLIKAGAMIIAEIGRIDRAARRRA
jgi:hypothetical protein